MKEGIYEERFGDLEKLREQDITVINERTKEIKDQIDLHEAREKKKAADIEAAKQRDLEAERAQRQARDGAAAAASVQGAASGAAK